MGFFSKKIDSVLGVDLGASSVKMVELKREKRQMHLVTYGYSEGNLPVLKDDTEQRDMLAELLKKVALESKVTTKKAVASVPLSDIFSAIVRIPNVSEKDRAALIEREAQKFLPFALKDAVVDWKIIDSPRQKNSVPDESEAHKSFERQQKKIITDISVLITAAPKNTVSRIADIFKRAGLELMSLETEAFALTRSLIGNDPTSVLIVDIGSARSNFFVVENMVPMLHRSMQLGGLNFTKALDAVLQVGLEKAEAMKSDFESGSNVLGETQGFPKIFENTIAPLIKEIRYTMNLYATQQKGTHPERIVLTGGSSLLTHLDTYLSDMFSMKVFVGDPWARVWYPENVRPALFDIGTRFAVAVGLALREGK